MDGLGSGIFASECGQRFLQILLEYGNRGFKALYDKCRHNLTGGYYQMGLSRVHAWPDETIDEDSRYILSRFPDADDTFRECFQRYLKDGFRECRDTSCPTLNAFARAYYVHLGEHQSLLSGDYFSARDVLTKRYTCMDACRHALFELTKNPVPNVVLASEASYHPDELNASIHPHDSISQVGAAPPLPRRTETRTELPKPAQPPPSPPRTSRAESNVSAARAPASLVGAPAPERAESHVAEPRAPREEMPPESPRRSSVVEPPVNPPPIVRQRGSERPTTPLNDDRSVVERHEFVHVEKPESIVSMGPRQPRSPR